MYKKPIFFVMLAFALYLSLGLATLSRFITADEHFWLPNYNTERIQAYWQAVKERDWEKTRINDKPGVTLAYFSGIALPFAQPYIDRQIVSDNGVVREFDPQMTEKINFLFRLPLFLFNGLFIFYFFWILRKITGDEWVAAWASMLMLFSPVLLGISQIVNPDTLFWVFGAAVLFTFFAHLKFRDLKYRWLTALFFGLMLLSKYVGVIFFPFFVVMIFLDYLFRHEQYKQSPDQFPTLVKKDLTAYWTIIGGGSLVFVLLMPAALINPRIFFESTVGFGGIWPIFVLMLILQAVLLGDALFLKSKGMLSLLSRLAPWRWILEKGVYATLLMTVLFVLFNWMLNNSLYDLSRIPFDAKTKATFSTDNTFVERFVVEFVPLVFALTPPTLLALIFFWARALFVPFRDRLFALMLSCFILIFYLAVIEQGLLVTVRYSILLFPITLVLGALGLRALFDTKDEAMTGRDQNATGEKRARAFFSMILGVFTIIFGFMLLYQSLSKSEALAWKTAVNKYTLYYALVSVALIGLSGIAAFLYQRLFVWFKKRAFAPVWITLFIFLVSLVPLARASPHFFVYTSELLPKEYVITGSWGYGGYETAQYLNQKPNANNLTLWSDAYGVCEFFVGKCIRKQKLDVNKYPIDYFFLSYKGQLRPKFPYAIDEVEWNYVIDGRKKNYMRLFKSQPVILEEDYP